MRDFTVQRWRARKRQGGDTRNIIESTETDLRHSPTDPYSVFSNLDPAGYAGGNHVLRGDTMKTDMQLDQDEYARGRAVADGDQLHSCQGVGRRIDGGPRTQVCLRLQALATNPCIIVVGNDGELHVPGGIRHGRAERATNRDGRRTFAPRGRE